MSEPQKEQELTRSMNVSYSEPPLPRASLVIWIVGIGLLIQLCDEMDFNSAIFLFLIIGIIPQVIIQVEEYSLELDVFI